MIHAKFIQIAAAPEGSAEDFEAGLFALDKDGWVWALCYDRGPQHWLRMPAKRVVRDEE